MGAQPLSHVTFPSLSSQSACQMFAQWRPLWPRLARNAPRQTLGPAPPRTTLRSSFSQGRQLPSERIRRGAVVPQLDVPRVSTASTQSQPYGLPLLFTEVGRGQVAARGRAAASLSSSSHPLHCTAASKGHRESSSPPPPAAGASATGRQGPPEVPPLVVVDGHNYLYRAFHALPPLATSTGRPTGAIIGVSNMLRKLIREYPASVVAVVFDSGPDKPGDTISWRRELYSEYKATRDGMPEDLRVQVEPLQRLIAAMGLPQIHAPPGTEADDVLGTLALQAEQEAEAEEEEGRQALVIVTSDKDLLQVVSGTVSVLDTMGAAPTLLDPAGVEEKFGVAPEHVADYLALVGDKSDNIPGVKSVGEKTAVKLIQALGGVESIYERLEDVAAIPNLRGAKTLAGKLRAGQSDAATSLQLARVRQDVPLDIAGSPAHVRQLARGDFSAEPDAPALQQLLTDLEFSAWLQELAEDGTASSGGQAGARGGAGSSPMECSILEQPRALEQCLASIREAGRFALTVQATARRPQVVGLGVAVEPGRAAYIPLNGQLEEAAVLAAVRSLLEDSSVRVVGHDLKQAAHALRSRGLHLPGGRCDDVMLQAYVLNSSVRTSKTAKANVAAPSDVSYLAEALLPRPPGEALPQFCQVAGTGKKQKDPADLEVGALGQYAALQAEMTLRLHADLSSQLRARPAEAGQSAKQEGPTMTGEELYRTVELPAMETLQRMEAAGVLIDSDLLRAQSAELRERMESLEARAQALAGQSFSLASPKQLAHILFDVLGLPVLKKTPGGQASTAEPILQELHAMHLAAPPGAPPADAAPEEQPPPAATAPTSALPGLVLEHRTVTKLQQYTEGLPRHVAPRTGRVHTTYNQALTLTGRLSSSDPNLQNIPVRGPEGRRMRQAFVAPEGSVLVSGDYSQVELRVMAHLSQDAGLLRAFTAGEDVHEVTAREIFGVGPGEEVSGEQRRAAKAVNFGLIYGQSAFGLAAQLGTSRREAGEYIERYFAKYPGVARYMEDTKAAAARLGHVQTLLGRRIHVPHINARSRLSREAAERTAINAPVQGTAADLMKIAMIHVDEWLQEQAPVARLVMQVHDELVLEVPEQKAPEVRDALARLMADAMHLSVPLQANTRVGRNWEEAH